MKRPPPPLNPTVPAPVNRESLLLTLLFLVAMLNLVDRQVLNILAEPIKRELGLSDTQLGLLTGPAFAIFYALVGLPVARLADRPSTDRVGLIALVLALWSVLTALSGMVQNYLQLVLARAGIGLGEAGAAPASYSLIADEIPLSRRARAVALQGLGVPLGTLVGLVVGGIVADTLGWRIAFLVVGLPGLAVALVLRLSIKDPRRIGMEAVAPVSSVSWRDGARAITRSPALMLLILGVASSGVLTMGVAVWTPILLIRDFGLTPGEAGLWLGLVSGIAGALGMMLGGLMADRLAVSSAGHYATVLLLAVLLTPPLYVIAFTAGDWRVAIAMLGLASGATMLFYGPTFAAAPRLVPPAYRSFAAAVVLLFYNLIGLGLGPLAIGMTSDLVAPLAGTNALRWALIGCTALNIIPVYCFWRARRHFARELGSRA